MGDQKEFQKFSEKISAGLSTERMMKDIEAFSHLNRYLLCKLGNLLL